MVLDLQRAWRWYSLMKVSLTESSIMNETLNSWVVVVVVVVGGGWRGGGVVVCSLYVHNFSCFSSIFARMCSHEALCPLKI